MHKPLKDFIVNEYHKLVWFVRSLIADAADRDAEDVVQDVALGILNSADISVPIEKVSAYVYKSLRNRAIDYLRRRKEQVPVEENSLIQPGENFELRWQLLAALDTLDEKSRAVVIATELEGWTFDDLAEEWDEPVGTLLSRKSRAIKKLNAVLSKDRE
jgi:RNA polymerase sigma factor (sigma-70 family)